MILKLRDRESCDQAYASNQVVAHEQTIEQFRNYVELGENADLKTFAQSIRPRLEQHLEEAKRLAATHGSKQ